MKEALKIINECVLYKNDKEERLNKLDNIQKMLYSEFEAHHNNNLNLFELVDEISLKVVDRAIYDGRDSPLTQDNSVYLEIEVVDNFNELRNSKVCVLVERSKNCFYDA